jgi:hypothetical protein
MRKRTIFLIFILIYYVIKHYKTFENEIKRSETKKNVRKRKKTKNDALKILGDAFFIVTKRHLTQKNNKKH